MKKTTYLLGLFLMFQTLIFAQYTAIPDANFEQALITFGYDSEGTLDGQILTADAVAATGAISFAGQSITDLTGIEAFTNIDGLNVSYNPINVAVDLSNNTLLTAVNFEECNSLPSLDVSGLTLLESINIYGTLISTIDLSTNIALQNINARNGSLTDLDLSSNVAMISVDVKDNLLTSLDMRNGNNASVVSFNSDSNPNLTCILVDDSSEPSLASWNIDAGSTFVESDAECATLSRTTNTVSQFNLYPNPATTMLNIKSNVANGSVDIYNVTGRRVLSKTISLGNNSVNVSSLASGVYLTRISANGITETKKLIIK